MAFSYRLSTRTHLPRTSKRMDLEHQNAIVATVIKSVPIAMGRENGNVVRLRNCMSGVASIFLTMLRMPLSSKVWRDRLHGGFSGNTD